ncbi:C2H2 finger domain protein, partial [Aspergillus nomiae NRRL 13137]
LGGTNLAHHTPFQVDSTQRQRAIESVQSPSLPPNRISLLHVSGGLSGNRYWAIGGDTGYSAGTLTSTLAHPPPVETADLYHPLGFSRDTTANLAALAVPPPGMGTALDALTAPQPLNSRRPAAPSLPSFELPPPNFQLGVKYHPQPTHTQPASNHSVNSLLTPPASTQSGETPIPTTTAVTTAAVSASPDPTSSYAPAYWPGQSSYTAASAAPRQSWSAAVNPYPPRDTFSPSVNHLHRNSATSPPGTETIPSQPYDMNHLPPFQQPLASSMPGPNSQHHAMTHAMLTGHNAIPNPPPAPPPLPSNDPYMTKSSSAPSYTGIQQMSNPAGAYAPYGQTSLAIHPPGRVASNPPPHHLNYQRQPWPSYSLPAMNGPVMTNVHNPNGQMSLVGNMQPGLLGYNSGQLAMQQMYGGHPSHAGHASGPTNDRPFKCDQCPQSFNRNHDLKRHKRIHLSVKPFPCHHCDKSFSRKDALKRHILVKGCGKDVSDTTPKQESDSVKQEDKDLDHGLSV